MSTSPDVVDAVVCDSTVNVVDVFGDVKSLAVRVCDEDELAIVVDVHDNLLVPLEDDFSLRLITSL